jgi:hypothetical protein
MSRDRVPRKRSQLVGAQSALIFQVSTEPLML